MNAKQIKPYTFWIVCLAVLLVQVVVLSMFLVPEPPAPSSDAPGVRPPATAVAAKRELDNRLRDLDQLRQRADTTIDTPISHQMIDPVEAADVFSNYIVREDWRRPLEQEVQTRRAGVRQIASMLSERSSGLYEPVSTSTDPVTWYGDYETMTARLVEHLVEERVLELPATTEGAPTRRFYATNREIRQRLALVTADGQQQQFDDPARRDRESYQFRIVDHLARRLAAVRVTPVANPLAEHFEEVPAPTEQRVTLRQMTVTLGSPASTPRTSQVRLELEGPPAALMEAMRQLDASTQPIVVRLGSRWERREFATREKHSVPDVPLRVTVELAIMDYRNLGQDAN
ncbi:MAG: hypothetical protein EA401_10120 [Planctomycetota bacterium]|nr:MAG: hypothetical protein EA401_10120 [Planctomycetota bacterium]